MPGHTYDVNDSNFSGGNNHFGDQIANIQVTIENAEGFREQLLEGLDIVTNRLDYERMQDALAAVHERLEILKSDLDIYIQAHEDAMEEARREKEALWREIRDRHLDREAANELMREKLERDTAATDRNTAATERNTKTVIVVGTVVGTATVTSLVGGSIAVTKALNRAAEVKKSYRDPGAPTAGQAASAQLQQDTKKVRHPLL